MPWAGGEFSRLHNWIQDALTGINILSATQDEEDDNFSEGINDCLVKDGTNQPSADLPMGGGPGTGQIARKHTNAGRVGERDEYVDYGAFQDDYGLYAGVSWGDADAFEIGVDPNITVYVEGMTFRFKAHVACNAGATMEMNGLGAVPLNVEVDPVVKNDIVEDGIYSIMYDGANWQLVASGASAFYIRMPDTPGDYAGNAGQLSAVNDDEDAMEFVNLFRGSSIQSVRGTDDWAIGANTKLIVPMSGVINDNLGLVDGSNPGRFVIPTGYGGIYKYRFMVTVMKRGAVVYDQTEIVVLRNGSVGSDDLTPPSATLLYGSISGDDYASQNGSGIISLDEADFVELEAYNRDNAQAVQNAAWYDSYKKSAIFTLEFLGS